MLLFMIIIIIITVCVLSLFPLVNCRSRNARTYMISCTGLYQAFDFQASYKNRKPICFKVAQNSFQHFSRRRF